MIHGVYKYTQKGFNKVYSWLSDNVLTFNVEKTKYIFLFQLKTLERTFMIIIQLRHTLVWMFLRALVKSSHWLSALSIQVIGVMLDNNLSFGIHIDLLIDSVRKFILIFKNLPHIADLSIIKMVYLALGQSISSYCISVWEVSIKTKTLQLERV